MAITEAQVLQQRSHVIPGKIKITEYFFKVPLDYSNPSGESLRLFARSAERAKKPADPKKDAEGKLPWLLYLEGGPGLECWPVKAGDWQDSAMDKGYRVLMLDTRGNGLSTTITTESLLKRGDPEAQAQYLKLFRADNVVRDAEAIRMVLTKDCPGYEKWSILGQSFGGFCAINYLCEYSHGLREVFITGGLGALVKQPDPVYAKLMKRAIKVSQQYYEKFPEDIERMHRIIKYVSSNEINTPTGGLLIPERIQNLGIGLGFAGFAETLHNLILRMDNDLDLWSSFTRQTLGAIEQPSCFETNILYAMVHEPLYASGSATNWSAERMMKEFSAFNATEVKEGEPIMFTAEMVTRNTFKAFASLRPLLPAAKILAKTTDWPDLYNEQRLATNEVPVYAATYFEDLYVDFDFAQDTASKIKGCKQFITNTLYHDGVRADPKAVMEELFKLRDDVGF